MVNLNARVEGLKERITELKRSDLEAIKSRQGNPDVGNDLMQLRKDVENLSSSVKSIAEFSDLIGPGFRKLSILSKLEICGVYLALPTFLSLAAMYFGLLS